MRSTPTRWLTSSLAPTTSPTREPTERTVAVFAGRSGDVDDAWLPLGGWNGTAFVGPARRTAPEWAQGREIRVTSLDRIVIGSQIGPTSEACDGIDGPEVRVPVRTARPLGSGFNAVAVEGAWPLQPRSVVSVEREIPSYTTAATRLLGSRVPSDADGQIRQIVLADLDGDGNETSVVVYESVPASARDGSGFSLLFTIDTTSGRATEVESSVVPPRRRPNAPPRPAATRFRVIDVADLNADRIMEVVVRSWDQERVGAAVYEPQGRDLDRVAAGGCAR